MTGMLAWLTTSFLAGVAGWLLARHLNRTWPTRVPRTPVPEPGWDFTTFDQNVGAEFPYVCDVYNARGQQCRRIRVTADCPLIGNGPTLETHGGTKILIPSGGYLEFYRT